MTVFEANYKEKYIIEITFSTKEKKEVDFKPFLDANFSAHFEKFKKINTFKKFYIDNGNLVWDKNWTLIFPVEDLYCNNLLN